MKQPTKNNKVDEAKDSSSQSSDNTTSADSKTHKTEDQPKEYGGRKDGLDPTRYGDWEKNGRCIDF